MKPILRKALGPLYPRLLAIKTSPAVQLAKRSAGRLPYAWAMRHGGGRVNIDISGQIGLGAILAYVLRCHAIAEERGFEWRVVSSSPLYCLSGECDFLAHYFDRPPAWDEPATLSPLACEWALQKVIPFQLSLDRASELFARWLSPSASFRRRLDKAAGGMERFDLSVHFRGTDKFLETGRFAVGDMIEALQPHLPDQGRSKHVFLATDDGDFRAALLAAYPRASFTSFDIGAVQPGVPRHFSSLLPEEKAEEALVNIFLLGRAPLCVRTASYLSAMARVANPDLRTITVNRDVAGDLPFPDAQIRDAETEKSPWHQPRGVLPGGMACA